MGLPNCWSRLLGMASSLMLVITVLARLVRNILVDVYRAEIVGWKS